MDIQLAGKKENSLVNGEGMRYVIFVSGCSHHCKGCQNSEMLNYTYGDNWDTDDVFELIKSNIDFIDGVTYSGGDPIDQSEALIDLSKRIKTELHINIWCYTGYVLEDIKNDVIPYANELLQYIDVLVDGKFEINNIDNVQRYVGSNNQRIIDVKKSLNNNEVVLFKCK